MLETCIFMDKIEETTEKLRLLELEVRDDLAELRQIEYKITAAIEYEDALLERAKQSRERLIDLRNQIKVKSNSLNEKFNTMKSLLNIFTGNFYYPSK